jgi:hypothetical protein
VSGEPDAAEAQVPTKGTPGRRAPKGRDDFRESLGLCPSVPAQVRACLYELARHSIQHEAFEDGTHTRRVEISHREIAAVLGMAPNSAKAYVDWAKLNGWLKEIRPGRKGGGPDSRAHYVLTVPPLVGAEKWVSLGKGRYQLVTPPKPFRKPMNRAQDAARMAAHHERRRAHEAQSTALGSAIHCASDAQSTALHQQSTALGSAIHCADSPSPSSPLAPSPSPTGSPSLRSGQVPGSSGPPPGPTYLPADESGGHNPTPAVEQQPQDVRAHDARDAGADTWTPRKRRNVPSARDLLFGPAGDAEVRSA